MMIFHKRKLHCCYAKLTDSLYTKIYVVQSFLCILSTIELENMNLLNRLVIADVNKSILVYRYANRVIDNGP